MALLTAQAIVAPSLTPTYSAVNASDTITPDTGLFLHVKNANASPTVVTITDSGTTPGGSPATNPTVSVPASTGDRMIPISPSYVNPATGLITVSYSVTASVTAALVKR